MFTVIHPGKDYSVCSTNWLEAGAFQPVNVISRYRDPQQIVYYFLNLKPTVRSSQKSYKRIHVTRNRTKYSIQ